MKHILLDGDNLENRSQIADNMIGLMRTEGKDQELKVTVLKSKGRSLSSLDFTPRCSVIEEDAFITPEELMNALDDRKIEIFNENEAIEDSSSFLRKKFSIKKIIIQTNSVDAWSKNNKERKSFLGLTYDNKWFTIFEYEKKLELFVHNDNHQLVTIFSNKTGLTLINANSLLLKSQLNEELIESTQPCVKKHKI